MSGADLRKHEGTLWVKNVTHKYISVIHDFGREKVDFHLEPAGEPGCMHAHSAVFARADHLVEVAGFGLALTRGRRWPWLR
jgi:hypothetical protein